MAGLDKEETVSIVTALRDAFLRFGSTRLLALAMVLSFLFGLAYVDRGNAVAYGIAGALAFCGVLWSLHRQPHLDRALAEKA